MKIIVTGSLGNISQPLATELVQQGHTVTIISSQPDRQASIEALGATAAIGSLADVDFLATTFAGADAVYAMVPPSYTEPNSRAYFQRIGRSYAQAIQRAAGTDSLGTWQMKDLGEMSLVSSEEDINGIK